MRQTKGDKNMATPAKPATKKPAPAPVKPAGKK